MSDDLYDLRVSLLLGNYATAINDGTGRTIKGKSDEASTWERDFILLRAHIALRQYDVVTAELAKRTTDNAKAFAAMVAFLRAQETSNNEGMKTALEKIGTLVGAVKEWSSANSSLAISAATAYIRDRQFQAAMPLIHTVTTTLSTLPTPPVPAILELRSMMVDCLLRLHRPDLAEKECAEMAKLDDDSLFTTLATVSVFLAVGQSKPDKLREAMTLTEDVRDKNGSSVLLLNIMANINMVQGKYDQAEKYLLDALEKRSTDVDTLVALSVCSLHMKKSSELVQRYLSQLKTSSPYHPWVQNYVAQEQKLAALKQQS